MPEPEGFTEGEYRAHAESLRALARRLLAGSDDHAADDAVGDTWLRFLRKPPEVDRPLGPWLSQVLRNRARELRRSAGLRGALESSAEPVPLACSAADEAGRREILVQLRLAVKALREPYRTAIRLRFQSELSTAEIATRLAVPLDTVRARIRRGLSQLRDDLDRRSAGQREDWLAGLALLVAPRRRPRLPYATAVVTGALGLVSGVVLWMRPTPPAAAATLAAGSAARTSSSPALSLERVGDLAGGRVPVLTGGADSLSIRLRRAVSETPVNGVSAVASFGSEEIARGESDARGEVLLPLSGQEGVILAFGATPTTDPLRVDLSVDRPQGLILSVELPAVCDVTGVVEQAPGVPAGGILVQAIDGPFPHFLEGDAPDVLASTSTLSDGSFRLPRVPIEAGLLATDEGGTRFGLYGGPRGDKWAESPVWSEGMPRGPEHYLDAGPPPLIRLAVADTLSVVVLDPDGHPLANAELVLKGSSYTLRRDRSDAQGRATFHPLTDKGIHVLAVRYPGLAEWAHGPYSFERGAPEIVVRLEQESTISGTIFGRGGESLSGARIQATMLEASESPYRAALLWELPLGFQPAREALSDAHGRFEIGGLGGGRYILDAIHGGTRFPPVHASGGDRGLVLRQDEASLRLHGTVVDARDGRPIHGALVAVEQSRGLMDERFSMQGARLVGADFAFSCGEPGTWVLHAVADGYAPFSTQRTTFGPGTHRLEARLEPARDVVIRLNDARGRPVTRAWVVARAAVEQADPGQPRTGYAGAVRPTDADGTVRLEQVPAAAFAVDVHAANFMRVFPFQIPAAETLSTSVLTLTLDADCATPRLVQPWTIVDASTGREPTAEELDALVEVFDEQGTFVMSLFWRRATAEERARDRGHIRVPSEEAGTITMSELTPPGVWWWLGPGPLFSRDGRPRLPPLHLATGRYRIRLTTGAYHPIEEWITVDEDPSDAAPLRLVARPIGGEPSLFYPEATGGRTGF